MKTMSIRDANCQCRREADHSAQPTDNSFRTADKLVQWLAFLAPQCEEPLFAALAPGFYVTATANVSEPECDPVARWALDAQGDDDIDGVPWILIVMMRMRRGLGLRA